MEVTTRIGKLPAPPKIDPVAATAEKYASNGWTVIRPTNSTNDLIASRAGRLHFVQVLTPTTRDDARYKGIPRNEFIQNAFSNGAAPIHALVVTTAVRAAPGTFNTKITFEDVNADTRVLITSRANTQRNVTTEKTPSGSKKK